jgi:hypothetical protein
MMAKRSGLFERTLETLPPESTPSWGWMSAPMVRYMGVNLRASPAIYAALAKLVETGRARRIKCPVTGAWLYARVERKKRRRA